MKILIFFRAAALKNVNEATYHWITQRLSSLILIPLTIIFIFSFVKQLGLGYEQNIIVYKDPLTAFLTFLFISITLLHFKQGLEVVIGDYIHDVKIHKILAKTNVLFLWTMNLLMVFALLKIFYE